MKRLDARYACFDCGAKGVRLWRYSGSSYVDLLCAECAEQSQREGREPGWVSDYSEGNGDQIGWMVPAVPNPLPAEPDWLYCDDTAYWGYTSVPPESVAWWKALPETR